jgi:hypothetical protein
MLLALVGNRLSTVDYGRHPTLRRLAVVVLQAFCGFGALMMFGIIGVALWSSLSSVL